MKDKPGLCLFITSRDIPSLFYTFTKTIRKKNRKTEKERQNKQGYERVKM